MVPSIPFCTASFRGMEADNSSMSSLSSGEREAVGRNSDRRFLHEAVVTIPYR